MKVIHQLDEWLALRAQLGQAPLDRAALGRAALGRAASGRATLGCLGNSLFQFGVQIEVLPREFVARGQVDKGSVCPM